MDPLARELAPQDLRAALATVPRWSHEGQAIRRTVVFADFAGAMRFVADVGTLAERAWHHPDIDVRWNQVTLVLTTREAGGLTARDFDLAVRIDGLLRSRDAADEAALRPPRG